jgi:hypothetical protein
MLIVPAILAIITYYLYQYQSVLLGFNFWYFTAALLAVKLIYLCLIWQLIAFSAVLLKNVAAFLGMGSLKCYICA